MPSQSQSPSGMLHNRSRKWPQDHYTTTSVNRSNARVNVIADSIIVCIGTASSTNTTCILELTWTIGRFTEITSRQIRTAVISVTQTIPVRVCARHNSGHHHIIKTKSLVLTGASQFNSNYNRGHSICCHSIMSYAGHSDCRQAAIRLPNHCSNPMTEIKAVQLTLRISAINATAEAQMHLQSKSRELSQTQEAPAPASRK